MTQATLTVREDSGTLSGDLTFATAGSLHHQMQAHSQMPDSIDLADVGRIDSGGLALLLEWQSIFRNQAGPKSMITINNPPPALMSIARLCDASQYLAGNSELN